MAAVYGAMSTRTAEISSMTNGAREDGVVKSFNMGKGYGFIRMQGRDEDVYFKAEDLTPRSKQFVQEVPRINGTAVTCTPEAFGACRVRARSVRLANAAHATKQPTAISTGNIESVKTTAIEPPQSEVSLSTPAAAWKQATQCSRSRGWGVNKAQEAQLMGMGFSEEAARDALQSGLDFNEILDKALSSGPLDSVPTTREGSDAASDHTSSCGAGDNSPESKAYLDEELAAVRNPSEAACHISQQARQLARVSSSWKDENSASLSVQSGCVVYTWTGTATENGWIYAEGLKGGVAGWIPSNVIKLLPLGHQMKRVTKSCKSFSDLHLAGDEGDIIVVNTDSTEQGTDGGWIGAKSLDGSRAGWFPTCALEQLSPTLQWMHALSSQASSHETQASVEEHDIFLVDPDTRTKEGWAYAWAVDRLQGEQGELHSATSMAGWVPASCLEWPKQ